MESRLQNHEFGNNPENFHPCIYVYLVLGAWCATYCVLVVNFI